MTDWARRAERWRNELASDPTYHDRVKPLIESLLPFAGPRLLDLGCGEGRIARELRAAGREVVGLDVNPELITATGPPAVISDLPHLGAFRTASFDAAYAVLVLEHIEDLGRFFYETARVVRPNGVMAVVVNHPVITSPGATTVVDPSDGEVFWRWGDYFSAGITMEGPEDDPVVFHHRSMAELLTRAAREGWLLDELIEEPGRGSGSVEASYAAIPVLAGVRWIRA